MKKYRRISNVIEAVEWKGTNVTEVYEFIHNEKLETFGCSIIAGKWNEFCDTHINRPWYLKTPESDDQTQRADVGDYIIKAYSEKLGYHFYPVKPDYFEANYRLEESMLEYLNRVAIWNKVEANHGIYYHLLHVPYAKEKAYQMSVIEEVDGMFNIDGDSYDNEEEAKVRAFAVAAEIITGIMEGFGRI